MATGRSTRLTQQIGEYLVAAELARRGYIATTFTGNVPDFDLVAIGTSGQPIPVQVKTIRRASWQFNILDFLDVELAGDLQVVRGPKPYLFSNMLCVFVKVGERRAEDEFYIFRWKSLQDFFRAKYKSRVRPRNPKSFHCAVWPKDIAEFKENWGLFSEAASFVAG